MNPLDIPSSAELFETEHSRPCRSDRSNRSDRPQKVEKVEKVERVEKAIEYHFLKSFCSTKKRKTVVPYMETDLPAKSVQNLFSSLRKKLGIVESCKEYSLYRHWNMVLTVLPDGSSFCHQVLCKPLEDKELQSSGSAAANPKILVVYSEKVKISNDIFPPEFSYDEILDVVDIGFPWSEHIEVVLSTRYQNDETSSHTSGSVKNMGRPVKIQDSSKLWCEMYIKVDCECSVEDVHECVRFVERSLKQ
jgi:hypothetical protein